MASGFPLYPFPEIEKKWQDFWVKNKTFKTPDPSADNKKPKYYILDMFPYPSGSGLHVGHLEGYTATDILARYKRMRGFNVMHPIGWDAFGLPAEQYAIETGTHPRITTEKNINTFRRQIQAIGFSYDWDREVNTTDPNYYKWTQWIFSKLYEKGLAYEAEIPVNWCPALGTVLANEEVIDGKSERGNHPVIRKPMRQWVLKITAYAERLIADLDTLDWPEAIKEQQRNWIGKSVGAEVEFKIEDSNEKVKVYTTRPDTLFGATYLVLSPEHALVSKITTATKKAVVQEYQTQAQRKSDLERTDLAKTKTGVFTGAYAINPVTQKAIPVWIADYVLATYGTGAIMAVPAHDERDFEFAKKFSIPVIPVIYPAGKSHDEVSGKTLEKAFTEEGVNYNSGFLNGMKTPEAKEKMIQWLEENKIGKKQVQYKLRDWLFSRQRYWGEPFPIVHVDGKSQLVKESELPVRLPEVESYKPTGTGESPLAGISDWVNVKVGGKAAKRETNTMPQWAGSCWYYLRYLDPDNSGKLIDPAKEKYWMPVDLYVGGAEHAVLHLLYSRFWHKVLYDLGVVSTKEPFQSLTNQGMILGEDNQKMSKSRGNVVNPEDVMARYGADSVRLYEMFMGPLEMTKPWTTSGVEGVYRFLGKVWRLFTEGEEGKLNSAIQDVEPTQPELKILHKAIKKVTEDTEGKRFNTAISAMMVFANEMADVKVRSKKNLGQFLLLLAPYAPHLAEELWHKLGNKNTLAYEAWPKLDESILKEDAVEMAVLMGGKPRAKIVVPVGESEDNIKKLALEQPKVQEALAGKTVKQMIVVPGRVVNIVAI